MRQRFYVKEKADCEKGNSSCLYPTGHRLTLFIRRIQAEEPAGCSKGWSTGFQVLSRRYTATFRVPGHFPSRRGIFCRYYLEDACIHGVVDSCPWAVFVFLPENQNLKEVCERTALTVRGKRSI